MNKPERFSYGKNYELRDCYYVGDPLEALLYDAIKGVPLSRLLIAGFFSSRVERGDSVPDPIMKYLATVLGSIADGTPPAALLYPTRYTLVGSKGTRRLKTRRQQLPPFCQLEQDMVLFARGSGKNKRPLKNSTFGKSALEIAGEWLASESKTSPDQDVPPVPIGTVDKQYKRSMKRTARLTEVQSILDMFYEPEYQSGGVSERYSAGLDRLNTIYSQWHLLD